MVTRKPALAAMSRRQRTTLLCFAVVLFPLALQPMQ